MKEIILGPFHYSRIGNVWLATLFGYGLEGIGWRFNFVKGKA